MDADAPLAAPPPPSRGEDPRTVREPAVVLRGLTKRYGSFQAVAGLDLEAFPGEILSLLGPNGAGKTTTIRMLMGILSPSAGRALVHGLDCFGQRADVMRHVGYVPDEPTFYDYLTGRELLDFVLHMHGVAGDDVEARLGVLLDRLGLTEAIADFAVNYSKGMKKKLAIACALAHEPDVVILDEPTNGLDPYATRTMHEILREQAARGACIFFSTHLLDQAEKLSDRVAILFRGRLAAVGRLEDLRSRLAPGGSLEEVFFSATSEDAS